MISFFRNWCEGIIVAVIVSVIIEHLVPEDNIKKYVKVVVGIYIIYTILNPFLKLTKKDIEFDNMNLAVIDNSVITNDTDSIRNLYANGIKENLKKDIEENFNVQVENLNILYDDNYENITEIKMNLIDNKINSIKKIEIGNTTNNTLENESFENIEKYIFENYGVARDKIIIN